MPIVTKNKMPKTNATIADGVLPEGFVSWIEYKNYYDAHIIIKEAYQECRNRAHFSNFVLTEIADASLSYWIEYNHAGKGIEKYREWLDLVGEEGRRGFEDEAYFE